MLGTRVCFFAPIFTQKSSFWRILHAKLLEVAFRRGDALEKNFQVIIKTRLELSTDQNLRFTSGLQESLSVYFLMIQQIAIPFNPALKIGAACGVIIELQADQMGSALDRNGLYLAVF